MGIQQKYCTVIILSFIMLSCSNKKQELVIIQLKKEKHELIQQASDKQKLLDSWFEDFASIQKEINSINTEEVMFLHVGTSETPQSIESDKDILLDKVERIKILIQEKENKLSILDGDLHGVNLVISNLKESLEEKENIINSLQVENKKIKIVNEKLKVINDKQSRTIGQQEQQLSIQLEELKNKQRELRKKEVEIYSRLSRELYSVADKLPTKIKGWFTRQAETEISRLKRNLHNDASKYEQEAKKRKYSY